MIARSKTQYCLGLIWSLDGERVLLIQKQRPKEQAGLWNGIGGKVETLETPLQAMIRECREETALSLGESDWRSVGSFGSEAFRVHCYTARADLTLAQTSTDERVEAHPWAQLAAGRVALVEPLAEALRRAREKWLVNGRWLAPEATPEATESTAVTVSASKPRR